MILATDFNAPSAEIALESVKIDRTRSSLVEVVRYN